MSKTSIEKFLLEQERIDILHKCFNQLTAREIRILLNIDENRYYYLKRTGQLFSYIYGILELFRRVKELK